MCDCPADWVVCFRRDCERVAALNDAYQRQIRLTLEMMGDPRISVSLTPEGTLCLRKLVSSGW